MEVPLLSRAALLVAVVTPIQTTLSTLLSILKTATLTSLPKHEESPRSRYSFPFNFTQVCAIVFVASVAFLPLGAAGAALFIPKTTHQFQDQTFNATCPPLPISPQVISAYLQDGTCPYDFSSVAIEDHPAMQAISIHQAKNSLLRGDSWIDSHEIDELRNQEADACAQAADLEQDPVIQLQWAARGLKELNVHLNPKKEQSCYRTESAPMCDVAATLWYTASQAFIKLPPQKRHYSSSIVRLDQTQSSFSGNRMSAAICLTNAAYCTSRLGNNEEAQEFYDEALQIMRNIDTTSSSLEQKVELQDQMVSTCLDALASSTPETVRDLKALAFSEAMKAQNMYSQLNLEGPPHRAVYFNIKRALRLEEAAYCAADLTQKVERLREARDLVQEAWNETPHACRLLNEFTRSTRSIYRPFSLEDSLLGHLNRLTQEAEQQLFYEHSSSRNIVSAWNGLRQWFYCK